LCVCAVSCRCVDLVFFFFKQNAGLGVRWRYGGLGGGSS
jgi:hypothetical protein